MKNIKIIADSTIGLTEQEIKKRDITIIPLNVIIDGVSYKDEVEIFIDEVLEQVNKGVKVGSSQPAPELFEEAFLQLKEEGATDILCFTLSSTLSGTYQSAIIGKMDIEDVNIHIIDTLSGSIGSLLMYDLAMEDLDNGMEIADMIKHIEVLKKRSTVILNMENLNALKISGRISRIRAAIGNLIKVKPILEYKQGILEVTSKYRTESAVHNAIVEKILEDYALMKSRMIIYIGHVYNREGSKKLQKLIERTKELKDVTIKFFEKMTAVIAINIGFGGIGISWVYE